MSYIITHGLGGKSLVTQGFGSKWQPLKELPKRADHHTRGIELCPSCGVPLKNQICWTRDVLRPDKKIYRCKNCFEILELKNDRWVAVGQPYRDLW